MTHTAKTLSRSTAGQAVLELALALLILLPILVGIADFGRYAYASIEVVNAAHAGAMYGAQNASTACDKMGMVASATADASDMVGMTATASGNNTNCRASALCACSGSPQTLSSCSTISCTGANRVVQYVKVNTTATVTPIFNYPGFPSTLTLTGQAIMRVEQ